MQNFEYHPDIPLLVERIEQLHFWMTKNRAELLEAIYQFDSNNLAPSLGASSTSTWLCRVLGISKSTAYEYVRVSRQIVDFPELLHAFSQGHIDYSTVRLLLKYMTSDNEQEFVELAKQFGHEQMKKLLAGHEPRDAEESPDHYFKIRELDNGDVAFEGVTNAADGAALRAALKIGEAAYYGSEEEMDAPEAKPARQTVSGFGMPVGRELLKAFMGIVGIARTKPTNPLRSPGANVNIVLNGDAHAYMPSAPKAPSRALENLVANALSRLTITDRSGQVLNVGRAQRLATDKQINALMTMWGHQCAMPGCNHTRFLEIHHMEDWADGGETNLENLIPLCGACHSLVTDGFADIERHGGEIRFFFGDGSAYVSRNHSTVSRDDSLRPHPVACPRNDVDSFADEALASA